MLSHLILHFPTPFLLFWYITCYWIKRVLFYCAMRPARRPSGCRPLPTWAPFQYPIRRFIVRSRGVSKPRDWWIKLSRRFEIWQVLWQPCCCGACQVSERSDNSKYKSRGFETLRDLTVRRLVGYWNGALWPARWLLTSLVYYITTQYSYCIQTSTVP